jgi:hypothetical protein
MKVRELLHTNTDSKIVTSHPLAKIDREARLCLVQQIKEGAVASSSPLLPISSRRERKAVSIRSAELQRRHPAEARGRLGGGRSDRQRFQCLEGFRKSVDKSQSLWKTPLRSEEGSTGYKRDIFLFPMKPYPRKVLHHIPPLSTKNVLFKYSECAPYLQY